MPSYKIAKQFIDEILIKLNDSNGVTWTRAEIMAYLREGLRVINSLHFYQKDKIVFDIPLDTTILDLTSIAEFNNIAENNVTTTSILDEINWHLAEEAISKATIDKQVFDSNQFTNILEFKINEFLAETKLMQYLESYLLDSPPILEFEFPENVIELQRLYFNNRVIEEDVEEAIKAFFSTGNEKSAIPKFYSNNSRVRSIVTFYPMIDDVARFEAIIIKSPNSGFAILPIPANLAWIPKYGTLSEIFSQDGNGYDPQRADYCNKRWKHGIALASQYFSIMSARINGNLISFTSIDDLDRIDKNWRTSEAKKPYSIAPISWNLIALSSKNTEVFSLELDVLSNTIVPSSEDDFVEISKTNYQALVDYVLHISQLKFGGPLFVSSTHKLDKAMKAIEAENMMIASSLPNIIEVQTKDRARKFEAEIENAEVV